MAQGESLTRQIRVAELEEASERNLQRLHAAQAAADRHRAAEAQVSARLDQARKTQSHAGRRGVHRASAARS